MVGYDLPAEAAGLARGRGVAAAARMLLAELNAAGALDWSRAVIDGSHVRALERRPKTGPSPVDRARTGSKHHVITEAHGIPLAVVLTGGNRRRRHPAHAVDRGDPPGPGTPWASSPTAGDPPTPTVGMTMTSTANWWRQGDCPVHRPPRRRARLRARRSSLGGRAEFRTVALVPTPAHPMGNPRRHPRSIPQLGLRHHLPAATGETLTLLGVLIQPRRTHASTPSERIDSAVV